MPRRRAPPRWTRARVFSFLGPSRRSNAPPRRTSSLKRSEASPRRTCKLCLCSSFPLSLTIVHWTNEDPNK